MNKTERGGNTHQSSTSELPVNAWQMIITLSLFSFNFPHVLYATGTSLRVSPHSSVKDGRTRICWSMATSGDIVPAQSFGVRRRRASNVKDSDGKVTPGRGHCDFD